MVWVMVNGSYLRTYCMYVCKRTLALGSNQERGYNAMGGVGNRRSATAIYDNRMAVLCRNHYVLI